MGNFKRINTIIIFSVLGGLVFPIVSSAQDGVIGGGFGTNDWSTHDALAASAGSSFIITLNPNATGNQYYRVSASSTEQSPSAPCTGGDDLSISMEAEYTAGNTNCTNGAWYYNCPNTSDNYVFKTPNSGGSQFVIFQVQGTVETITVVTKDLTTIYPKQAVVVTATVSGTTTLPTGESVYLRYTDDGFTSSTIVEMTYSGSNEDYTANIPSATNAASATIQYYIFTSGDGLTISPTNADWYTINLNNNGGSNYSYTVEPAWTTNGAGDGSWNDPNMWDAVVVPPSNVPITIEDDITLDQDATVSSITINASKTFTASDASARRLSVSNGGTLTNNGTYTKNIETIDFEGSGTISGTCDFNNLELNGAVNPGTGSTVSGTLEILAGGSLSTNSFTYANGSTLKFNTGEVYNLSAGSPEWKVGVDPHHLTISAACELWLYDDFDRTLNGNLTIDGAGAKLIWEHDHVTPAHSRLLLSGNILIDNSGDFSVYNGDGDNLSSYDIELSGNFTLQNSGTFVMDQQIGDDLYIAGDLTNNATFNTNNRLIVFNGTSTQNASGTFTGTSQFHYIELNNTNGLNLNSSAYVEDLLTLTDGHFMLGTSNLTIGSTATISGTPTSSNMIVPISTGELRKEFTADGAFTFPVGDNTSTAEYSPVDVTINSTTSYAGGAYISVLLADEKHTNNGATTDFLTRHWTVSQSGITDINYDMDLTYLDTDINGTEASIVEIKSSDGGTTWTNLGTVDDVNNKISLSGMASFSIHTGGDVVTLPVELLYFTGEKQNNTALLTWETASETNCDRFTVYHSGDGYNFNKLTSIDCAGNSNVTNYYNYSDEAPSNGWNYYRLHQTDFDGKSESFDIVALNFSVKNETSFVLLSFEGGIKIAASNPEKQILTCTISDLLGRTISTITFNQESELIDVPIFGCHGIAIISIHSNTDLLFLEKYFIK
ncbi:MAG: hypothetical protein JKY53_12195 [Flavobacteriales bacterium]|nr:hypothetical protein [Flavobacteriales bacterium]